MCLYLNPSFEPPPTLSKTELKKVGVLGDMIATPCLIEYFWTPPISVISYQLSVIQDSIHIAKSSAQIMDSDNLSVSSFFGEF